MKILFVAGDSPYNRHVEDALRENGHEVHFVDARRDHSMPAVIGRSDLVWRLSRRIPFLRRRAKQALHEALLAAADAVRPDMLFAIKGTTIRPGILTALRERGIRTVCWFPENAANDPYATWVRTVGPLWDHFLSFDAKILEQMPTDGMARVGVLPFGASPGGFDPGVLSSQDHEDYACEVAFVGAPYPDRVSLLERVRDRDLKIWGWNGWKKTSLAKHYRGPLDAKGSGKAYRLAKICVNTNVPPLPRGANCRTYEIPAAGGFELTDEPADLHKSFVIGKELDTFHSFDEFEKKVRYWLAHDTEREAVARAGHARLLRDHTLVARMRTMLAMIND